MLGSGRADPLGRSVGNAHSHRGEARGQAPFIPLRQLRKGDAVVLPVQSANRDSRKFHDPQTVDFGRRNANNHLTCGAGIHRCLGSHLATAQLHIAPQEVHRAIPDYRIDGNVTYMSVGTKATPKDVPFVFTPTSFKA